MRQEHVQLVRGSAQAFHNLHPLHLRFFLSFRLQGAGRAPGASAAAVPSAWRRAMVKLTLIARVADGLPLAEGLETEKNADLDAYKQQAKARAVALLHARAQLTRPRRRFSSGWQLEATLRHA